MTRLTRTAGTIAAAALILSVCAAAAVEAQQKGRATLDGYQEVQPGHSSGTLSTSGAGTLEVEINPWDTAVSYTLSYQNTEAPVLQAHIHLGRPAVNGGIMVFLCTNLGNGPAGTPACPPDGGTVTGTLTASGVIGPAGQGVAPGEFAEFLAALRAEAGYGNVHTSKYPAGEIRGQVTFRGHGLPPR